MVLADAMIAMSAMMSPIKRRRDKRIMPERVRYFLRDSFIDEMGKKNSEGRVGNF